LRLRRVRQEGPDRRHLARGGGCAQTSSAPIGKKGAQVRSVKIEQCKAADLFAAMPPQEINEPVGGRHISPHRMRAPAPIMGKIASPTRRKRSSRMPFPL
jgi:hypothetical protein